MSTVGPLAEFGTEIGRRPADPLPHEAVSHPSQPRGDLGTELHDSLYDELEAPASTYGT